MSTNTSHDTAWHRRWWVWVVVAALVVVLVLGRLGSGAGEDDPDGSLVTTVSPATPQRSDPSAAAIELSAVLRVTDQKDGDSWVASDGEEYRLGLVNTPEVDEPCGTEATAFTRDFLAGGFTVDAYASDTYGRRVAEVLDLDGNSLNVALAASGLGDGRFLDAFRDENPDLADRVEDALASASVPDCRG